MEKDAQSREAEILRGAGTAFEGSHGKISRLSLPTSPQTHLHRRWQETQNLRVQDSHEEKA